MEITEILYYIGAIALISFGIWGTIDAIRETKNNK
jgi:hypothetical protein